MSLKNAAEELLKVADEIEKEAADVTQFVCDKCNHTASLAAINQKRKEAAEASEDNVAVKDITINDTVNCPACDGVMAYKASKASDPYYFDPEQKEAGEKPESKKAASEPIDYDSLERYTA